MTKYGGVDEDSEVHRFVASGVVSHRTQLRRVRTRLLRQKHISKTDVKGLEELLRKTEGKIQILCGIVARLQTVRATIHDRRYDNGTLLARDKGKLMVLSPCFLQWGYALMKKVRASVSVESIRTMGRKAQKRAHEFLYLDKELRGGFSQCCKKKGSPEDKLVTEVFERLLNFAFHARSEVEWQKYRAIRTDRSLGNRRRRAV
uniref:Uncharacterized protein n=1 Tax=Grammatophora oceanica TaxID=210454 RepID=A0A7S1V3C2_9STRA|mmetsp:Transcript_33705/g.49974  ORF Transcript_33705/g.49974 Transcript_33705/m.49974 type:complete len:203 (+) Transcript_33705:3-611(+)